MNLLCPNCQKMLTVPEQYAGQLMKCPLCAGTFTVPALPSAPAAPQAPGYTPSPPPPDVHSYQQEPPSLTEPVDVMPEPHDGGAALPAGYRKTCTLTFSPKWLMWIPLGAVVLIFILQFFSWVGFYPGGVPMVWQSAWGAAFNSVSVPEEAKDEADKHKEEIGVSVLTIVYVLLFVILALPVTIAAVVFKFMPDKLPAGLRQILPWMWGIVAAVNVLVFFFLALQLLVGFSIESKAKEKISDQFDSKIKDAKGEQKKVLESLKGAALQVLHRTLWLRLAVCLHLLVIVCALLLFWVDWRGLRRPLPRLQLQY
jgi:hypothetical protein